MMDGGVGLWGAWGAMPGGRRERFPERELCVGLVVVGGGSAGADVGKAGVTGGGDLREGGAWGRGCL